MRWRKIGRGVSLREWMTTSANPSWLTHFERRLPVGSRRLSPPRRAQGFRRRLRLKGYRLKCSDPRPLTSGLRPSAWIPSAYSRSLQCPLRRMFSDLVLEVAALFKKLNEAEHCFFKLRIDHWAFNQRAESSKRFQLAREEHHLRCTEIVRSSFQCMGCLLDKWLFRDAAELAQPTAADGGSGVYAGACRSGPAPVSPSSHRIRRHPCE